MVAEILFGGIRRPFRFGDDLGFSPRSISVTPGSTLPDDPYLRIDTQSRGNSRFR